MPESWTIPFQMNLGQLALSWVGYDSGYFDTLSTDVFFKAVNLSIVKDLPMMVRDEPKLTKFVARFLQTVYDLRTKVFSHLFY